MTIDKMHLVGEDKESIYIYVCVQYSYLQCALNGCIGKKQRNMGINKIKIKNDFFKEKKEPPLYNSTQGSLQAWTLPGKDTKFVQLEINYFRQKVSSIFNVSRKAKF